MITVFSLHGCETRLLTLDTYAQNITAKKLMIVHSDPGLNILTAQPLPKRGLLSYPCRCIVLQISRKGITRELWIEWMWGRWQWALFKNEQRAYPRASRITMSIMEAFRYSPYLFSMPYNTDIWYWLWDSTKGGRYLSIPRKKKCDISNVGLYHG